MPSIKNKLCIKHGIYNAIDFKRCPDCKSKQDKMYDKTRRNKESKQIYNSTDWGFVRKETLLRDNFLCVSCDSRAEEVDHVIELIDGGEPYELDNLQSLCKSCHAKKTYQEKLNRK